MENRHSVQQRNTRQAGKSDKTLRCCCGSLLARVVAAGVEIKCRRCKRQVILALETKGAVRLSM